MSKITRQSPRRRYASGRSARAPAMGTVYARVSRFFLYFGALALILVAFALEFSRLSVKAQASPTVFAGVPLEVSVTDQLSDNLAFLFEAFGPTEFIVCLEGEITREGELELRDFRLPHIAHSHRTGVGVDPDGTCRQYEGIIGTLHNHPPAYPEDRDREWNNCYLSRSDITSWLEHTDYPITAVMCAPHTWAWWHRSQVAPERVLAFPPDGQLVGRYVTPRP